MKKSIKLIFTLLVVTLSFNACAKDFRVAVLYWSTTIEGQVAMKNGLEGEVQKINKSQNNKLKLTSYIAGDGANGIKNQIAQFKLALKATPAFDLIIIQPTDNAALSGSLQEANRLKIPVVAYDQYIVDGELASFITSNNYQAGRMNAEYVDQLFENSYSIKIVLAEYPKVSSTVERVDGFFNTLKNLGQKYEVIKTYEAVEPVGGKKAGLGILKSFPIKGSVDVVFSINDGGGISIAKELLKKGRKEIIQVTVDGDPVSLEMLKKGELIAIDSAQFCSELGRQSAIVSNKILLGQKFARKVLVPTFPITRKTIKHYTGWNGKIPAKFIKPWNGKEWRRKLEKSY